MPESTHAKFFEELEKKGVLRNEIASLGWAFWPYEGSGYFDEGLLRILADEIERRNKPFWDEYEAYCKADQERNAYPHQRENLEFGEFDVQTASAVAE